jgi:hypothetical protein
MPRLVVREAMTSLLIGLTGSISSTVSSHVSGRAPSPAPRRQHLPDLAFVPDRIAV